MRDGEARADQPPPDVVALLAELPEALLHPDASTARLSDPCRARRISRGYACAERRGRTWCRGLRRARWRPSAPAGRRAWCRGSKSSADAGPTSASSVQPAESPSIARQQLPRLSGMGGGLLTDATMSTSMMTPPSCVICVQRSRHCSTTSSHASPPTVAFSSARASANASNKAKLRPA